MTIGKRKGATAKGAGKTTGDNFGGSLSKNDHWYLQQGFGMAFDPGVGGPPGANIDATGGVINDFTTPPGAVYRAHKFTSSGSFDIKGISASPTCPNNIEYLVVAVGGGGGAAFAGAGGAGGLRTNLSGHPFGTSVTFTVEEDESYPVIVGAGGGRGIYNSTGNNGGDSSFGSPTQGIILSTGGGFGGGNGNPGRDAGPGGSGGSAGLSGGAGNPGSAVAVTTPSPWPGPSVQGYAGGTSYDPGSFSGNCTGGGGGAGSAGGAAHPTAGAGGNGGDGKQVLFMGPSSTPLSTQGGAPGNGPTANNGGWYCGGGGGSSGEGYPTPAIGRSGGGDGGFNLQPQPGHPSTHGKDAMLGTGSGGGASGGSGSNGNAVKGGRGASGVVLVRYQIAQAVGSALATGGDISFNAASGKTIHTFVQSGTFSVNPTVGTLSCDYLVVAGGGSGGTHIGGGGGAGGLLSSHPSVPAPLRGSALSLAQGSSTTVTIGAGAAGNPLGSPTVGGVRGNNSSFGPISCTGGGGGGSAGSTNSESPAPAPGGSGGGSGQSGPGGTGTSGQGNSGGASEPGGESGSGGGGAGAAGVNGAGPPGIGGAGGAGMQVNIYPSPTLEGGWYYAGGGGGSGGGGGGGAGGPGGVGGGGGASQQHTNPHTPQREGGVNAIGGASGADGTVGAGAIGGAGAKNSGGGGGGGAHPYNPVTPLRGLGGLGGSGIVIVAYDTSPS